MDVIPHALCRIGRKSGGREYGGPSAACPTKIQNEFQVDRSDLIRVNLWLESVLICGFSGRV